MSVQRLGLPPGGWYYKQGFETSGPTTPPANWFRGGEANFAFASPALVGAQSLKINASTVDYAVFPNTGGSESINFSEIWVRYLFRVVALPSSFSIMTFFNDISDQYCIQSVLLSNGTIQLQDYGGIGVFLTTVGVVEVDTTYQVWLHYKAATTTSPYNGVIDVAFAPVGAPRPKSGDFFVQGTVARGTLNTKHFMISSNNSSEIIYDEVELANYNFWL